MHSNHSSAIERHLAWIWPVVEQSFQIVLRHHTLLAALLKQEASDGHLDQSVLVPLLSLIHI